MADTEKRLRYFNGQFLQERDFTDEQTYHLDRQRRHNRQLHSAGIAEGLTVSADPGANSATVFPGTAIDGEGRTIVLSESRSVAFGSLTGWVLVVISYGEQPSDPATVGDEGNTRVWERPEVKVIAETGAPPADERIRLARLQIAASGTISQHDTSVRTAAGKLGPGSLKVQNPIGGTPQFVQDQNGNRSPLAIGAGKNVGIGTTAPGSTLTVAGDLAGPLVEVNNQNAEATIRYVNKNGTTWHVGSGGVGGSRNFIFWNEQNHLAATITSEGSLSVKGLEVSSSTQGLALTVSGNSGTAPLAQLISQSNEASIRYVNSDGSAWHLGSGGQGGPKNFFFWSDKNGIVGTITPDGTLTLGGGLAVKKTAPKENPTGLRNLMLDPATGQVYNTPYRQQVVKRTAFHAADASGTTRSIDVGFQPKFISMEGRSHAWLRKNRAYGGAMGGFCRCFDDKTVYAAGHGPHIYLLAEPPYVGFYNEPYEGPGHNALGNTAFHDYTEPKKLHVVLEPVIEAITDTGFTLKFVWTAEPNTDLPSVFGLDLIFAVFG